MECETMVPAMVMDDVRDQTDRPQGVELKEKACSRLG